MERKTIQRQVILKVIEKLEHSTIPDILDACKKSFASISVATVYRNLEILEKENLIRRIPTKFREDVYESTTKSIHDHFICNECYSIVDLSRKENFEPFVNEYGDQVTEKTITYYGTCLDCLNSKKC